MTSSNARLNWIRLRLLDEGQQRYQGEPVCHLDHALQSAWLAQRAGAKIQLVVAALLHDIGHLSVGLGDTPSVRGIDDRHEERGAQLLEPIFGPGVSEPVRVHVLAKRALVRRPAYLRALSEDSRRSLELQGGALGDEAYLAFLELPYAAEALALRRWDDAAKRVDFRPWSLEQVWNQVEQLAAGHQHS
jgi:Predicted HD phosphohydrolase